MDTPAKIIPPSARFRSRRTIRHFVQTLGDWCAATLDNGEERDGEWVVGDLENTPGDSCWINLRITVQIEQAEAEGKFDGLRVLSARVEGHQARLLTLNSRADELRGILQTARARAEALHTPEELLSKIAAEDGKTRLALKAAIARRVAKIEVHFHKPPRSPVARVTFSNGAVKFILVSSSGGAVAYDPVYRRWFTAG